MDEGREREGSSGYRGGGVAELQRRVCSRESRGEKKGTTREHRPSPPHKKTSENTRKYHPYSAFVANPLPSHGGQGPKEYHSAPHVELPLLRCPGPDAQEPFSLATFCAASART